MTSIRELDPKTVERIAAGEVVERPASVVKELVENSLDADAGSIEVAVESGGKDGIRVTDDGVGMSESAVRRAVEQHTTSKIRDVDDLESGVATLGFRGEALHAIGAVSRLTIETRLRDADRGTKLCVDGGEVTTVEPTGCPAGTTVAVEDLFYNVPARRKYLKQDGTEFAHVNTVVTSYALANPDVRVALEHDGRETFATTGQGDLRSTVMAVYGRDVATGMVNVEPGTLPEGPLTDVDGLVSHPETTRAGREYVNTYINGRYVRSTTVRDAIVDAYGTQLAPDRYPFAVLFLDLPGETVDVNVHPRKMEVRFADAEGVAEQVRTAVREALLEAGIVRSSAPRGKSAPEQTEIDPESDDAGDRGDRASEVRERPAGPPTEEVADGSPSPPPTRSGPPIGPDDIRDADPGGNESAAHSPELGRTEAVDDQPDGSATGVADESTGDRSDPGPTGSSPPTDQRADRVDREDRHGRFRPGTAQTRLGDGETVHGTDDVVSFDRLPSMRVLGQVHDTYLVAETDDGLVLVDQHAADERVNYEQLRDQYTDGTATQALADPVELSVTAREAALFDEFEDALARVGFRAELDEESAGSGDRQVVVRTVPELVAEAAGPELIREVLSAFVTGEAAAAETVDAAADDLLADMACYPSITGNTSLSEGSVVDLLEALDDCENPWACPHGRPVVIELDRAEIEARFERDYPGHSG